MDNLIARRRMNRIASHVTSFDNELSSHNSQLFPLNCSSTLNSIFTRGDNTLFFARQGSASQAYHMQQASIKQNSTQTNIPSQYRDSAYEHSGEPLFSRQAQTHCNLPTLNDEHFVNKDTTPTSVEAPKFARQYSEKSESTQLLCNHLTKLSLCKGKEWSPRIDVAESGTTYTVTVELPGVSIMDIRVEVNDQKLIVTGKRSTQQSAIADGRDNSNYQFHRREILQGPYRVCWPLPSNVNKDLVSAEFVNGFLRITLPKM